MARGLQRRMPEFVSRKSPRQDALRLMAPTGVTPANANRERRGFMCDRHGNLGLRNPATAALDRRSFLKASALGTITMAVAGGMMGRARAALSVKGTHGDGFCNEIGRAHV